VPDIEVSIKSLLEILIQGNSSHFVPNLQKTYELGDVSFS